MTPVEAVLVLAGIPLAVTAIVTLLVLAPGWTRDGRAGSIDAWSGDPLEIGAPDRGAAALGSSEPGSSESGTGGADGSGGTSARW